MCSASEVGQVPRIDYFIVFKNSSTIFFIFLGIPSPLEELEFNWDEEQYSVPYRMALDNSGICTLNRSNGLTYDAYGKHRFLIVYANSPMGVSSIADPNR